jgi:small-conductance mechanosensitive channel
MTAPASGQVFALPNVDAWLRAAEAWIILHVLNWTSIVQAVLLVATFLVAWLVRRSLVPVLEHAAANPDATKLIRVALLRMRRLVLPGVAALLVWLVYLVLVAVVGHGELLRIAANLLTAWVVIHLATAFLRQRGWASLIAGVVWLVTALAILELLGPLHRQLDGAVFRAGELEVSLLGVLNGLLLLIVFIFASGLLVRVIDERLGRLEGVSAAARVLVGKVLRIALYTLAAVIALMTIGVDLTALAVFSGALGLGIGFGLQKVVSNLFSGIILLLDRSLKPGDVIEVGSAYGMIRGMGARYVTVGTRDGKEYLIPNEDLVTHQVVNWSYSDRAVRNRIKVGIHYTSDVHKAIALMTQAALAQPRVLRDRGHEPQVRLIAFADSSVDLELRIWITDPEAGLESVASDIRLAIWDLFHENGVEFPFPQRDLHIRTAPGLRDLFEQRGDSGAVPEC